MPSVANRTPTTWSTAALQRLREDVPRLVELLACRAPVDLKAWQQGLDGKLLPRLAGDVPLTVAVCGGGSAGKSSLFNALVGERLSPVGGRAGINRRILVAANPDAFGETALARGLAVPFGERPGRLRHPGKLTVPGRPVMAFSTRVPPNLVLLDTPDFDTGAHGAYTNRDLARQALEAADVLIYIFTNATYNNRDNTDFLARMLTGLGQRRCVLVYRVYPGFTTEEVREHAATVAANLYGDRAAQHVAAIFRVDEDNRVAAGERPMAPRPLRAADPGLAALLAGMDPVALRTELLDSMLQATLDQAERVVVAATAAREALDLYADLLAVAEKRCLQQALGHFPVSRVLQRFAEIWLAGDPPHIRIMRRTGRVLDLPVRAAASGIRYLRGRSGRPRRPRDPAAEAKAAAARVEHDLIVAVEALYRHLTGPQLELVLPRSDPRTGGLVDRVETLRQRRHAQQNGSVAPTAVAEGDCLRLTIDAPPSLDEVRGRLDARRWQEVLGAVLDERDQLLTLTDHIDAELREVADDMRRRMGVVDRLRQTFAAMLNVLPATAAVTYILSTGDPVGAAGIKVKLAGLFGLKDLYALVALPATSGMKNADRRQLEAVLQPLAAAWLRSKLAVLEGLFRTALSGRVTSAASHTRDTAQGLLERISGDLATLRRL